MISLSYTLADDAITVDLFSNSIRASCRPAAVPSLNYPNSVTDVRVVAFT